MLNDVDIKNSWDSLWCKYQLKQITQTREKIAAANENCISKNMDWKLQNRSLNISILEQTKVVK